MKKDEVSYFKKLINQLKSKLKSKPEMPEMPEIKKESKYGKLLRKHLEREKLNAMRGAASLEKKRLKEHNKLHTNSKKNNNKKGD